MKTKSCSALLALLLLIPAPAFPQPHRLNVINLESGLDRAEITREIRRAIRTVRRQTRKPYRIVRYRERIDESNPDWPINLRVAYQWLSVPARARHTTIAAYRAGDLHPGYGVTILCTNFLMMSIPAKRSPLWIKFVLAHEIGHTLGALHDESEPLSLMYPWWDVFLREQVAGAASFQFSENSLAEMRKCSRFTLPGGWVF